MTSILCACAVHVLFMRYDVIVGIPLIAIWGGGGNLLRLQYQINMNLVFHISEDGSEIKSLCNAPNFPVNFPSQPFNPLIVYASTVIKLPRAVALVVIINLAMSTFSTPQSVRTRNGIPNFSVPSIKN